MSWDEGIEGENVYDIITSEESPLCVIAGPGTGKTFALMRKIARMIEEGKSIPEEILLLTFTRATAQDMITELGKLDVDGTEKVNAKTLHSFCFSTLNSAGIFETTGRNPRTLLDFEKRFLIEDLKNMGLGSLPDIKKDIKAFEAAWAKLQHEEPGWPNNEHDKIFSNKLESWLIFHDAMLMEELIPQTLKYLRDNPACAVIGKYKNIFVDEYQDLNKAEQKLVELLAPNSNVMVIGDEDQSIYESFRYANPEGILEYAENVSENSFMMYECRRCPENVVKMANSLIGNNELRIEKKLETLKENGLVCAVQWEDIESEINGISQFVSKKIEEGFNPGKILILCPNRQIGYRIRDKIRSYEIDAHSFFNEELLDGDPTDLEKSKVQKSFSILALLANPEDQVALRCCLGFGSSSLLSKAYLKILEFSIENDTSIFECLEKLLNDEIKISHTYYLKNPFSELKQTLSELKDKNGFELVDELFPEHEEWASTFRILLNDIKIDTPPSDIYEELKAIAAQPVPDYVDYVRIMSLHKSKGLTAELVVICGCIDGLIPFRNNNLQRKALKRHEEEQRRLFYVGITRTTDTLILSSVYKVPTNLAYKMGIKIRRYYGRYNAITITSPFIHELGPELPPRLRGSEFQSRYLK